MKTKSTFLYLQLLLSLFIYTSTGMRLTAQSTSQASEALASESLNLAEDMEVGLEIEARSPDASWARSGAEAAALLVLVDGVYNQDLLLWAGDELFRYRVLLGRLSKGKHTLSVALNPSRSAPRARRAEVKALRPLPFVTTSQSKVDDDHFALAHSPVLY